MSSPMIDSTSRWSNGDKKKGGPRMMTGCRNDGTGSVPAEADNDKVALKKADQCQSHAYEYSTT